MRPAAEPNLIFPSFHIRIEQKYLDILNGNPAADTYYPASLTYGDITMDCRVRYRGATSRSYPKKNWKVKFADAENIFHQEELNFNAPTTPTRRS